MPEPRFEWDPRKDRINRRKHGISFEEARSVFFDEGALVAEILREAVRVTVREYPKRTWKGLARAMRRQVEKTLKGRVYKGERCGNAPLCEANEPYDPWSPSGQAFKT